MSEFIERIARDLWNAGWATDWEEVDEHTKELTRDQARAAIKAMIKPTGKMCDAGVARYYDMSPTKVYQAMLTAALEDD